MDSRVDGLLQWLPVGVVEFEVLILGGLHTVIKNRSKVRLRSVFSFVLWAVVSCLVIASGVVWAEPDSLGWKPHSIRVGDGQGGWTYKTAEYKILHTPGKGWTCGFGIVQMDNGELALLATNDPGKSFWYGSGEGERGVIAFGSDRGDHWSDFQPLGDQDENVEEVRPMLTGYLGNGVLTYKNGWFIGQRHFSRDFGRTWEDPVPDSPVANGTGIGSEGNPLVERDDDGTIHIAEIGYNLGGPGVDYDVREPEHGFFRWSHDGGKTWTDEVNPPNWYWDDTHNGKTWRRGISEGSLVRAANGWLVAALRTGIPASYFDRPHNDEVEGTGTSISKDNGKTWSPVKHLFKSGRMHAHLLRLPDDTLLMNLTVRNDIVNGEVVSYRRGCEAIVSRDNGLTWDVQRKYVLDEWQFYYPPDPFFGLSGHLSAALLDDSSILTVHNNYLTMGITLIRWKP